MTDSRLLSTPVRSPTFRPPRIWMNGRGMRSLHVPLTTCHTGLVSDTSPVAVTVEGVETFLADSCQIYSNTAAGWLPGLLLHRRVPRVLGFRHLAQLGRHVNREANLKPMMVKIIDMDTAAAHTMTADVNLSADRRAGWLRLAYAIGHRWPTWLALAFAAISLYDYDNGLEYVIIFVLPPAGYLFLAVVDRPRITWAVVLGSLTMVIGLRLLDVDPWPALAAVAVALGAVGLIGGQLRRPGLYAWQLPGALAFIGTGLIVLSVPTNVAGYLVAIGLLGHATWDAVHWWANKVVARSFAEWCGVLDFVLAVGALTLALR